MSLLCMCAYCTPENGKLKYLEQTLDSLANTVDFSKHRLIVINNGMDVPVLNQSWFALIEPGKNLGTAEGINLALKERQPGEFTIKCDDDWTTEHVGWVDEMEAQIKANPQIGILGLKRDDVYGELIEDGELLWNADIMGTCTMLNPAMLDKVGRLVQFSQYGYDDCIMSVRSMVAGFKNAFMKNIKIVNLDEGGTDYTAWKQREATVYSGEAAIMMDMIKSGQLDYYYPFEV